MENTSKPTTSYINNTKPNFAELWSTITTTWATETRTWQETASLIGNLTRQSSSITNVSKP